jgi:ATP-dependent Clp protease ATP-binding subunit ClpB
MQQGQQQLLPEENIDAIDSYGINLTDLAKQGKIDPVIGRENEIRRIVQILSRRTKNNPVLIGEPGTGKTTIVEGLAKRIIEGDVPENMLNQQLITLDLFAMLAGAMFKGQFEERLKNFIKQVVASEGEFIVFIDELHTIVGAGNPQGGMDVSNILKPELAKGQMSLIGATTLNEYQKYIEQDSALERRFQKVILNEPSVEDTITILRGIKDKYELHHGININDSALIAAATLSDRYISDRFLPDKAVDLMDEAASKIRIEMNSAPVEIDDAKRHLLRLEIENEALKKEGNSNLRLRELKTEITELKNNLTELQKIWEVEKNNVIEIQEFKEQLDQLTFEKDRAQREGNLEVSARIQYQDIPNLQKQIETAKSKLEENKFLKLEVAVEDVAEVVSMWSGIPINKMLSGERQKLLHLEEVLDKKVLGQTNAVKRVCDLIRMSKTDLTETERPLASLLFLGNTGVGKTELAKTLAIELFDHAKALVRIDMSELMERHSVAKLIGSPPGYIGHDEGGQLTEKIRRKPYAVILFDEIEKAHPEVLNILLQVLDDGRLTDSKGRTVDFRNTIIIMTSNIKSEELKSFLRPEFINRIDEIVNFNDLEKETIKKIVELQFEIKREKLFKQGINIEFSDNLVNFIADKGFNSEFGARPVKRTIQREAMVPLSKLMIQSPDLACFKVSYDGEIRIESSVLQD